MSAYAFDADFIIDIEKRIATSLDLFRRLDAGGHDLLLSVVAYAEYYSGVWRGVRPAMDDLIDSLRLIDVTEPIAAQAARYRLEFKTRGRPLQLMDCLIAATARELGATLVTRNLRDYPMTDIQIVSPGAA